MALFCDQLSLDDILPLLYTSIRCVRPVLCASCGKAGGSANERVRSKQQVANRAEATILLRQTESSR
jgi:hypothetical protein